MMDTSIFLAAAATVTKVVDFVRNLFDPGNVAPKWIWNVTAFVFGVVAAYVGHLNIYVGDFSTLVTGLAIGASASGFHEVFSFFSSKAKGVR